MTVITWSIDRMQTTPTTSSPPECVVTANWRCVAVDGSYQSAATGVTTFTYKPGSAFTPYANLTQDQVLKWCWDAANAHFVDAEGNKIYTNQSGVNKEATEKALKVNIQNQKTPPVIQPPLPWSN